MFERKADSENAVVLCASPAFSARRAVLAEAKAASVLPSTTAAMTRRTGDAVSANDARVMLARRLPIITNLLLPYLSAKMPKGILAATMVIPITVITSPVKVIEIPLTEVRKKERSV